MTFTLGVHLGQQNASMDELRALWRRFDGAGLDWISVWDHLYEAPPQGGTTPHFEAVATLTALAAETTNARIGCLMFCVPYRNPALLAKAAVAIDHVSDGRLEVGLGAGWHAPEFLAHGYEFGSWNDRFGQLEEGLEIMSTMWGLGQTPDGAPERTSFEGEHFRVDDVSCVPGPVRGRIPIWVGGRGPKRTPRLAAKYADGYNVPYVSPEMYGELCDNIDRACGVIGRNPSEVERTVNLSFSLATDAAGVAREERRFAAMTADERAVYEASALRGSPDDALERLAQYRAAGATGVNIALRLPVDDDALSLYLDEVVPAARREFG